MHKRGTTGIISTIEKLGHSETRITRSRTSPEIFRHDRVQACRDSPLCLKGLTLCQ